MHAAAVYNALQSESVRSFALALTLYAFFFIAYSTFSSKFESERKRAYILSSISSCTMSLVSLPFVGSYLVYGLEESYQAGQQGWMATLGRFGTIFFGTYLTADLTLGYLKYPSQIGLLTGWIHHLVYISLMVYCRNSGQTPIFMSAAIMEFPTFDLAISNLVPKFRNDLRFLCSFFLIRIAFHIYYIFDVLRPAHRGAMNEYWVPVSTMSLALVLHVMWFQGGVKGYLKRTKARKPKTPVADDPLTNTAAACDAHVQDILPPSEPATPEDSPLVTPHTPKSYAVLGSLPNLPNLPTMPHLVNLAHIPNVSMPSLADFTAKLNPRDQLNFGFRDAVKNRWDEQRDRFAGIRGGGGMGLDFGRLGLRRRAGAEVGEMTYAER